jgi:uncharacterized protein with WD repeat
LGSSKKTPDLVYSQKLSKPPETQFSGDEKVYARLANDSIIFAEIPDFHNTAKKTPEGLKVGSFSLSPGQGPLYVFCYIPGITNYMYSRTGQGWKEIGLYFKHKKNQILLI